MYALGEAARAADATEEELLKAIRDGLLPARVLQNTGQYGIDPDDLAAWVKRSRHADPLSQQKKKKVLLLGEDTAFAGTLKLDLSRNSRIDVRFASWGKDAILMVDHYGADLFVVDLTPSKAAPEEVLSAVSSQCAAGRGTAIATCALPRETLEAHPLLKARLEIFSPQGFVSRAGGMRALQVAIFGALGLQTNTRILRLQA